MKNGNTNTHDVSTSVTFLLDLANHIVNKFITLQNEHHQPRMLLILYASMVFLLTECFYIVIKVVHFLIKCLICCCGNLWIEGNILGMLSLFDCVCL